MGNPVVLITGGLTGIGRSAAVAQKGAKVVVAGRRPRLAVGRSDKTAYYNVDAITRLGPFA